MTGFRTLPIGGSRAMLTDVVGLLGSYPRMAICGVAVLGVALIWIGMH